METIERLRVELGDRGYDILVGPQLIERAGREMLPLMRRRQAVIVSDEIVAGHYLASLRDSLSEAGIAHHAVLLPPGEETKDLAHFGKLAEDILAIGIERGSMLVALGGGVVGDMTGFAAATLLRGIDFVQIPTTLLAQVDSSVGGKTGINTRTGKNLIGAFYQPRLVLADTSVLGQPAAPRAARRLCRDRQIRPHPRCRILRLARSRGSPGLCARAGGAAARGADQLRDEGRDRRRRRARGGRPGAPQFRPHLRARSGGRDRVQLAPAARRGSGARHGSCGRLRRKARPRRGRGCAAGAPPSRRLRPSRRAWPRSG